ncbi:MAG: cytochrome C-binding protein [Alphaproteobacteria bacterium]|nr:cytochrome C-binding protein [Alphaproteobacteria bacterium]
MKIVAVVLALALACGLAGAAAADDAGPPGWAYAVNPPGLKPAPDEGRILHVPGSAAGFTLTQIRDLFNVPDWYPDDHPAMPEPVAHGRKPDAFACGFCHLPNGLGRPENASLAGLPAEYIERQIADFRAGLRKSSVASLPPMLMVATAKGATDADVKAAAAYFSALKLRPWIRVEEAARVPKTRVLGFMLVPDGSGETEAIGDRIIEMPEDVARTELRDSRSGFVAYAPPGSLLRGAGLVATGGGKTVPCGICHGADLQGIGPVPALAGRSPSYLFRQLYDIKHGTRAGTWAALMAPVVANLDEADMVALAAYAASRAP